MTFRDGTEVRQMSKVEGNDLLTLRGELWVVSRDALIEMKARAARAQDVFDIERLKDLDR